MKYFGEQIICSCFGSKEKRRKGERKAGAAKQEITKVSLPRNPYLAGLLQKMIRCRPQ